MNRNKAVNIARGKWIQFIDSDDLLMNNALEILYNYAENYNADVVCMHRHFIFDFEAEKSFPTKLKITPPIFGKPFVAPENIAERIKCYNTGKIRLIPWLNFLRRDFLIESEVYFPEISYDEDDFWIIELITKAEKILCIPDALCINRTNPDSLTRKNRSVEQQIATYMMPPIVGMKFLKKIFDDTEFFRQNPQYWYGCAHRIISHCFGRIFGCCANLPPHEVYRLVKEQFSQELGEHTELVAYLCSMINNQQKQLYMANQKIAVLEKSK